MDENIQAPAPDTPAPEPAAPSVVEAIQPELTGVPAPQGYDGPWPKPGMDGGNPSSWLEQ